MVKAVLIDLSGTLHVEDTAITGAAEALEKLRKTGLFIRFVTNTTKENRKYLHNRLTRLGFNINFDEIHSSLDAARSLIVARQLKPLYLLSEEALEDFSDLIPEAKETPNAVLIGLAPKCFEYETLNKAFRCLQNGAQLIAIHEGKYYKRNDGLALGPGCFVKGLEFSAQCKSEVVGKPNQQFFESALGTISPVDAIMIGDDVNDDIKGALNAGMQGILVKTGKYREGDEDKITPKPSYVCASFVEAVEEIIKLKNT